MENSYLEHLKAVQEDDLQALVIAEKNYGDSWKRRGGVGAFMMLARKWDRLEKHLAEASSKYDIFSCAENDKRPEGIIDDIRDLRRYLILVEGELRARGNCPAILTKDRV
jgi:hypothetical protein